MELNLCGSGHCPKVVSTEEGVNIGEEGNLVKLKPQEWDMLVDAINNGKIGKV